MPHVVDGERSIRLSDCTVPKGAPDRHLAQWYIPVFVYVATSAIAMCGVLLGHYCIDREPPQDPLEAYARFDGQHYKTLMLQPYTYDPSRRSDVAFFPAYPLIGRTTMSITGLAPVPSLLITSHFILCAAFVLFWRYLGCRTQQNNTGETIASGSHSSLSPGEGMWTSYALLAFAVWPTTFFLRMAYSESTFLLAAILALYGMQRRWPLPLIAIVVGFSTATRPVGIALVVPFVLHVVRESPHWRHALVRGIFLMPLACWGLLAYMAFQWIAFGDGLAFAHTQQHWRQRPVTEIGEKLLALLIYEPIWAVYDPGAASYWNETGRSAHPLFSLWFANPIYFVGTCCAIAYGAHKRWLSTYEWTASVGLLVIPYCTRGYEWSMLSQGRFAAAVFPMYIVLGRMLCHCPWPVAASLLCLSAFFMGAYAALFAAQHSFF